MEKSTILSQVSDIHIMKLQLKVYIFGCGSGAGSYVSLELVYIPLKRDSNFSTFPGYSSLFLGCLCDIACTMVIGIGSHEWKIYRRPCECWWSEYEKQSDETTIDKEENFITHEQVRTLPKEDIV